MNALQRIKLSRQLLIELSGDEDQQKRLQTVIEKLRKIPEDCLSYEHFRKIRAIVSEFQLTLSHPEISRLSTAVVDLCVDMIEYDSRVAELENIEY